MFVALLLLYWTKYWAENLLSLFLLLITIGSVPILPQAIPVAILLSGVSCANLCLNKKMANQ